MIRYFPLFLFALVAAVFLRSLGNEFVPYDDLVYIHGNPLVTSPSASAALWAAWTTPYEQNFTPLLWTSYRVLHAVFGENPLPFHLLSVFLHAVNAVLVFSIGRKLGGRPEVALLAALLWAVHPQRVEAVSWASALKDPASGLFALAAVRIWLDARSRETSRVIWAVCAGCFALSLLFKQSAMGLPVVLFGWHLLSRKETQPLLWRQHLPLFVLGIAGAFAAIRANQDAYKHSVYLGFDSALAQPLHFLSALAFTVSKALLPYNLLPDYPIPEAKIAWACLGLLVALAGLATLGLSLRARNHTLTLGLLWAGVLWLPASGIVPTPLEFTADRLTYLPASLLIPALLISCQAAISRKWMAVLVFLTAALGLVSIQQQGHWKTGQTLFRHSLRIADRHYPSLLNDAILRLRSGEPPAGPIKALETAIDLYPKRSAAYHKLIQVEHILGNRQRAEELATIWRTHCPNDSAAGLAGGALIHHPEAAAPPASENSED